MAYAKVESTMSRWIDDFWDFFGWLFFHEHAEEDEKRPGDESIEEPADEPEMKENKLRSQNVNWL